MNKLGYFYLKLIVVKIQQIQIMSIKLEFIKLFILVFANYFNKKSPNVLLINKKEY